ncbi:MAG: hypothetical protein AAF587_33280 [Bacteroidota bacterium]
MKLLVHPYRWILLVAISASMLLLLKINKRSFYFHYFKVIEEVELRNSQAVDQQVALWQVWSQRLVEETKNILPFLLTLVIVGVFSLLLPEQWLFPTLSEVAAVASPEPQFLIPPIRAP